MSNAPERICLPPIIDGEPIDEWLIPSIYSPPTDEMIPDDWCEYIRADTVSEKLNLQWEAAQAATRERDELLKRIQELKAARLSYGNLLGVDVGDIHEAIRKILAENAELNRRQMKMSEIQVDAGGLRLIAQVAIRHGDKKKFIDLALEWADKAQAHVEYCHGRIKELEDKLSLSKNWRSGTA